MPFKFNGSLDVLLNTQRSGVFNAAKCYFLNQRIQFSAVGFNEFDFAAQLFDIHFAHTFKVNSGFNLPSHADGNTKYSSLNIP